jgi:hypothetical protein
MIINNTTNVSDRIIQEICNIVIPDNTPVINEISLRNKMEGAIHGNWGHFYPADYKITICLPDSNKLKGHKTYRKYTKLEAYYESDLDFLAAVIGHEYYHAYQWSNIELRAFWSCTEWLEVEAERYESVALKKWQIYMDSLGVYKAVATTGK